MPAPQLNALLNPKVPTCRHVASPLASLSSWGTKVARAAAMGKGNGHFGDESRRVVRAWHRHCIVVTYARRGYAYDEIDRASAPKAHHITWR